LRPVPTSDWRIDELAQRAGVAVDTIRYYQREGLLASGKRNGRTRRFGPEHLEKLERIRALQARRFSLAAIRALLDREDPGALAGLLVGSEEATYDLDELLSAAGVDATFVRDVTAAGLLRDPSEHGRSAYDADDVNVLRAFADLARLAIPPGALVELARIYAEGLDEIQRRVVDVFTFDAHSWDEEHAERFRELFSVEMERFARDVRVIADYTQQRNLQRAVLHKIEEHGAGTLDERIGAAPEPQAARVKP
jgi:DNA-binding transcriptional MerR regulator